MTNCAERRGLSQEKRWLLQNGEKGGFGLAVKLRVEDRGLPRDELEALAREAHEKVCPYSHPTRGNVLVEFEVVGG
jgi:organic hydroperoxide reductase OsmC/OhrA